MIDRGKLLSQRGDVMLLARPESATAVIEAYFQALTPEAFDRTRGAAGAGAPRSGYKVDRGTALLPVMGALIPRGLFLGAGFAMSYEALGAELRRAASDPDASRIALMIDSPGGYVSGVDAAAHAISRVRRTKKVIAYVQGQACSAAYWLASTCDEVVCSPQSELGSIGVLQAHYDFSKMLGDAGLKVTLLRAGAKKVDGNPYEPLSDRVRGEMTKRLEQLRTAFAEAVAAGRAGLDVAAVLATEAATFIGAEAIAHGLADRVGFIDEDLSGGAGGSVLQAALSPGLHQFTAPSTTGPSGQAPEMIDMYTQAQMDAAIAKAKQEGQAEGRAATDGTAAQQREQAAYDNGAAIARQLLSKGEVRGEEKQPHQATQHAQPAGAGPAKPSIFGTDFDKEQKAMANGEAGARQLLGKV